MNSTPFGFRILGPTNQPRRLVNWSAAFAASCAADPRAEPEREAYLSLFTYGDEFRRHLTATGSTAHYAGPCGLPYLTFDIDRAGNLDAALADARALAARLLHTYRRLDDAHLMAFFSGAKGFHLLLPMPDGIDMTPSVPATARHLATAWAAHARVTIDAGIYDAVRPFRAPNSWHPKTGLHKCPLTYAELLGLSAARIVELAREPLAVEVPADVPDNPELRDDWRQAAKRAAAEQAERVARYANNPPRLPKRTLALIRGEWTPAEGDRHRLLFSAAASLGELGCTPPLALELLTEAGLNCGLTAADVKRQIATGLARGTGQPADEHNQPTEGHEHCTPTTPPPPTSCPTGDAASSTAGGPSLSPSATAGSPPSESAPDC